MPEFTIPQFIEHEPKIVGPLTFKQFIFFGVAGAICFILYFTVSFFYFLLGVIALLGGASTLAFVRIEGRPLTTIIQHFFSFLFSSKIYLWRKKSLPPKFIKKAAPKEIKKEEAPTLKITEKSQLKDLSTRIETGLK